MDVISLSECDKFALGFAVWVNENGYENYWNQDPSWISIEETFVLGEENAKRYTIEELLKKYKYERNT